MNRTSILALALGATFLTGCAGKNHTAEHSAAAQLQWNAARSGVLVTLAENQYAKGELDNARNSVEEALALTPTDPRLLVLRARVHLEQGRTEQAEHDVNAAIAINAGDADANYLAGVIDQRWQKPEKALAHYEVAHRAMPDEPAYVLAVSEMLIVLEREDEALALLRSNLTAFEHSAALRDAAAQLEMRSGRYAEAAELLRQASVLDADDVAIRENLGLACYQAGHHEEAENVLSRLVAAEPSSGRADLWLALAESRTALGQLDAAEEAFSTATKRAPHDPAGWLGLAKIALRGDDLRSAAASLRQAETIGPASAETHLLRGFLLLKQGREADATQSLERSVDLDHTDPVALCMLGHLYQKQGEPGAAAALYGEALRIAPDDLLAQQLMASLDVH